MDGDTADYVDLAAWTCEVRRFVERDDGWWVLDGDPDNWGFSTDRARGFLTSFDPPGGPYIGLGSVLSTAHGRSLVVASIRLQNQQLMVMLMADENLA